MGRMILIMGRMVLTVGRTALVKVRTVVILSRTGFRQSSLNDEHNGVCDKMPGL